MAEQRLIYANALYEAVERINEVSYGSMFSYEAHNAANDLLCDVKMLIKNAPTVPAVVLPCAVGDTVYKVDIACKKNPNPDKPCFCWDKGCNECDESYMRVWESTYETRDIRSIVSNMMLCGETVGFGKTAFLTRDEAEASLSEKKGAEPHEI